MKMSEMEIATSIFADLYTTGGGTNNRPDLTSWSSSSFYCMYQRSQSTTFNMLTSRARLYKTTARRQAVDPDYKNI